MALARSDMKPHDLSKGTKKTDAFSTKKERNSPYSKNELNRMEKGYKEMAAINLALSNLYFEAESEAQSYYDRTAECE